MMFRGNRSMCPPAPGERLPSVLLVDDDPEMLVVGRATLGRHFEVLTASSVGEALEALEDAHVGVLLTDLEMPRRDGLDLVREASRARPDIICMLLSGSDESLASAEPSPTPALHRVLRKPVPPGELREIVAHAVDVWLLRSRSAALEAENSNLRGGPRHPGPGAFTTPSWQSLREIVSAYERQCITETLAALDGNKSATARRLGLTYRGLLLKMQRYGMIGHTTRRGGNRHIVNDAS